MYDFTDRQIPSILSYAGGDEYYGTQAKNFLLRNPQNTIAYFRDYLGQECATLIAARRKSQHY